jgi:hypothetical protein
MKKRITGYRVVDLSNRGISYQHHRIDGCKKYCRTGSAVFEEYSVFRGIKVRIYFISPFKVIGIDKYSKTFNFLYLHISVRGEYFNKTGKEVWRPE